MQPLQATSIPRLDLLKAVLGLRLTRKLVNAFYLSMDVVTFWCDIMNVLWWIQGRSRKFKLFVANRVSKIQSITNPVMWKHVQTKINPADDISRGTIVHALWLNGLVLIKTNKWMVADELGPVAEEKLRLKKDRSWSNPVVTLATAFFSHLGFLSQTFMIYRTVGEGGN